MSPRLRSTIARHLRALAHRIDPTPQHGHIQHVHVTIRSDTSGIGLGSADGGIVRALRPHR